MWKKRDSVYIINKTVYILRIVINYFLKIPSPYLLSSTFKVFARLGEINLKKIYFLKIINLKKKWNLHNLYY